RLPSRRDAARRLGLGAEGHARRRARSRRALGLRADLRETVEGHLFRPRAAQALSDGAAVRHGGAAAARAAAENAARDRRARAAALSGSRPLADGAADP